jgi:hypothetical protein
MPWIIGIDEAGYGPNLGPLVMTSVACRVPEELADANLWRVLRTAVRRRAKADDRRLFIEDSKLVYSPARGLVDLETGVLATLLPDGGAISLTQFLDRLYGPRSPDHASEPWYSGSTLLPVAADPANLVVAADRLVRSCQKKQLVWGLVRSEIVGPKRFNELLDHWGSKGAVLGHALVELLRSNLRVDGESEPLLFIVDKHGGRNNYAAMLQQAFCGGLVVAREEGASRSVYQVWGFDRKIQLTIEPRADGEYFCAALASMVSKYVRELLMLEFNRFWQTQVPGLRPTAGYYGDAGRFYEEIRPAASKLGIPEQTIWRRR